MRILKRIARTNPRGVPHLAISLAVKWVGRYANRKATAQKLEDINIMYSFVLLILELQSARKRLLEDFEVLNNVPTARAPKHTAFPTSRNRSAF
jgi:hypothetical protein